MSTLGKLAQFASSQSGGIPVKVPGTCKFRPTIAVFVGSNLFDLMQTEPLLNIGMN
jgi:hypothetical protein